MAEQGQGTSNALKNEMRTLTRAYLILMKTAMVHDLENNALKGPLNLMVTTITRIMGHGARHVQLRLSEELIYVNKSLVRIDEGMYEHLKTLDKLTERLKLREITFLGQVEIPDLVEFLGVVKEAYTNDQGWKFLHDKRFPKIRIRDWEEKEEAREELSEQMRALRAYIAAMITVKEMCSGVEKKRQAWVAPTKKAMQDMVSMTYANPALMMGLIQMPRYKGQVFSRLLNTAVITTVLLKRLGTDANIAASVALSAAVHDLDWANEGGRATTIRQLLRIYRGDRLGQMRIATAADINLPDGLAAARVISVAAAYQRLTTAGDGKGGPMVPDQALRRIEEEAGRAYDPLAVQLLVSTLGVYPVGALVELSNGIIAVVLELPDDGRPPSQPVIKYVRTRAGDDTDGRVIDLFEPDTPRILRCLPPEELNVNVTTFFLA